MRDHVASMLLVGALFASAAVGVERLEAQSRGEELAALLPSRIGRATRGEVRPYSRFATGAYTLRGASVTLQVHEVVGEGAEAHQQSSCPRVVTIARRTACLRVDPDRASVSWVLEDALQVMLGAADEATVMALARSLNVTPMLRLAQTLVRSANRAVPPIEGGAEQSIVDATAPPPHPPAVPAPRPSIVSIERPTYPPEARARGLEGVVSVRVEVAADGSLTLAEVMSGDALLRDAALASVRSARFAAARDESGRAVAARTVVRVRFSLD